MTERAVLEYVANSFWQVPMLVAMGWLAIKVGKPTPQVQHRVWLMTLALSVTLPAIGPRTFPSHFPTTFNGSWSTPTNRPLPGPAWNREQIDATNANSHPESKPNGSKPLSPWPALPPMRLSQVAADWLLGIYGTILLLRMAQLAFARGAARRLVRRTSDGKLSPAERVILKTCCERLHTREPRILVSREIRSPMAVGGKRPAVLLPEEFFAGAEIETTAALCHELAHLRRGDYLTNWLCQLGSLPIAYHPATHEVQRRIRRTRELVCDAMAAEAVGSSVGYARCLVTLAQRTRGGECRTRTAQAPGLFDHDVFEERIMRLLETKNEKRSALARTLRATGMAALITGVTIAAAVLHVTPTVVNAAAMEPGSAEQTAPPRNTVAPVFAATPLQIAIPAYTAVPVKMAIVAQTAPKTPPPEPPTPPQAPKAVPPVPPNPPNPSKTAAPTPPSPPSPPNPPDSNQRQRTENDGVSMNRHLTPEQRARIEKEMAAARAQIQAQTKFLQSPEFKKQMADVQRQVAAATRQMQSAEMQRQMKFMQSAEFKAQMARMQQQVAEATKQMQSAEMQRQMKFMQSPEFKKQMAEMQQQITEATKQLRSAESQQQMKVLQSAEFKAQMAEMQRKIQEATRKLQDPELQRELKLHGCTNCNLHVPQKQNGPPK